MNKRLKAKDIDEADVEVARPSDVLPEWRFGRRIRELHRLFTSELQGRLDRHGVRVSDWTHLRVISDEEGLTQVQISRRLRIEKASSTVVLERLRRGGLIYGKKRKNDLRKIAIYLTPAGKRMVAQILPEVLSVINIATSSIGRKDMDNFVATITKITKNLEDEVASRGILPFVEEE